jgi:hypothetical protein
MKKRELRCVVRNLGESLRTIYDSDNEFSRIRSIYAEFLVAYELAKQGYEVQIGKKRKYKNSDLYLPNEEIHVEVKSGLYDKDGWTDASFGNGAQIQGEKFDYCVFVTFDHEINYKEKELFILTLKELRSIGKFERYVAKFETNTHLLIKAPNEKDYRSEMRKYRDHILAIELALIESPQEYDRAWEKIIP